MSPETAKRPSAASLEEALQEEVMRLEMYKTQLTSMVRQSEALELSLEAHARAKSTLEEMDRSPEARETLIPVGAETFIRATPATGAPVLLGMGRGVLAEVDRAKALEVLTSRMGQLESTSQELRRQIQRLDTEAQALQARLEASVAEAQRQGARSPGHVVPP